jgi:predicted component of type VI protein secretion system
VEELVKLVSEKTGLSEEMSEMAVKVVLNFIKDKLPEPIAAQIDKVVEGADLSDLSDLEGLAKGLGGLFG